MFKNNLIIFMTLHDLRQDIYRELDLIKNSFPLKLGGYELDLEDSYNLNGNFVNNFRYRT